MDKEESIDKIHGGLIISCQALPSEPLYTEEGDIISLMARAAQEAGVTGLRTNSVGGIKQIKKVVDLPMIGVIKRDYPSEKPYIAPIMGGVDKSMETSAEVIALNYILWPRYDDKTVAESIKEIKAKYPSQLLMADTSNFKRARNAYEADVDLVGITLSGYTEGSSKIDHPDFNLIKALVDDGLPVIAEGKVHTPEQLKQVVDINPTGIVVSGAIVHSLQIAKTFTSVFGK